MKTIASCVQEILVSRPFLEEALAREIINFSALAKDLNTTISEMLRQTCERWRHHDGVKTL